MKKLTQALIKKIINLKKKKVSILDISKKLNISKSSVNNYTKEIGITGEKNKGGRPKKLSIEQEKQVIDKFKSNSYKFLSDGREDLIKKYNITVTKQTVKNILNRNNVLCHVKRKKPLLSDQHKLKRYEFSIKYLNFGYFDWQRVIWSDESIYALYNTNRKEFYWKERQDPILDTHIMKTVKFGGATIMVWGCLTGYGVGELIRIVGTVNSDKYIEVLTTGLLKTMDHYNLNPKKTLFMQDNATCHKSIKTMNWLKANKITCIDWPAQSPDLNPIENVWEIIDKRLRKRVILPKNSDELWEVVRDEWYNIDKDLIRTLYVSMIRRVLSLNEVRGGYTKY